jgi:DNA polymerase II large subunit
MHAAMRRDCDGDEAAFMFLLDLLLNFSKEYLPAHRGGTQDAPLVLNARIKAGEVDDMVFDIDVERELPLELYRKARKFEPPYNVKISQINDRLGNQEFRNLWYEYEVSDINSGVLCSSYKKLVTMRDKVQRQMDVAGKIRAVNTEDVARLIIDRHFIRDIRGNLRKFSQQVFRCGKCNEKYRRPPLIGKCLKCGGKIIFTISEGSIIKYLEPAMQLAEGYDISPYIKQSLELAKAYIESIFGREKEKQEGLGKWV